MSTDKKVLIVEDDRPLSQAIQVILKKEGISFLAAYDGEEALELAISEKPDLILLDLMLPKIDGFVVLKTLREKLETKNTPVIIVSNLGEEEAIAKTVELGIVDYTNKSMVDIDDIVDKIKKYLK